MVAVRYTKYVRRRRTYRPTKDGPRVAHTTSTERNRILKRDKRTCVYCGQPATQVDHVIPIWRGGKSVDQNLVAACSACNKAKWSHLGGIWAEGLLGKWPVAINAKVSLIMEEQGIETVAEYKAWRATRNRRI